MVFCTAVDVRERLAHKNFGDLARKLPNAKILQWIIDTVRTRGASLPTAFEEWRGRIIWATAHGLAQEAGNDWPEAAERKVRIIRRKRDDGDRADGGDVDVHR
jgi:hypothetical protein